MTAGDKQAGFTLIELLVTIAVIIIIATIAVPGFRSMVADNRLTADFNQVLTVLHYARSEAAKQRKPVTVTIEDSSWAIEVTDSGGVLRRLESEDARVSIDTTTSFSSVTFNALGRRTAGCDPCSLTMRYEGEETLTVNLAGNISRP